MPDETRELDKFVKVPLLLRDGNVCGYASIPNSELLPQIISIQGRSRYFARRGPSEVYQEVTGLDADMVEMK